MNLPDPHFAARVRESFGRQKAMALIGASLTSVAAGEVELALPYREDLTQQKAEVYADDGSHVATMFQTLMALLGRPDTPE